MKSLIIGASGFVGGHLIRQLADHSGAEIHATCMAHEELCTEDAQVHALDILDKNAISVLLEKTRPQHIYHLAAQSSVKLSWEKPQLTADINIKGTINLLEAVRELDYTPRILLVGSGEEYGYLRPEEIPVKEETVLRAGNIYAATKACQGMLGEVYSRAYKMDIIMVRAFNHIGPGQSDIFVVSDFCRQVVRAELGKAEPVISVGNLAAQRDFTDVRDIVRAYDMLMNSGRPGETYNVGSSCAYSIESILGIILENTETGIEVVTDSSRMRPSDVPVIAADTTKLREHTGWSPAISLDRTINDILDYWRDIEKK
ncbi:MAG: NAD-dependent epimerase/dehydratase family protein [Ruminococcus sp.]|nr:NAD-dependent epimerase/dehydratase family protein [Ruminococcus sp.]